MFSNRDESIVSPEPEYKDDNEERTAPLTWNEPPQETSQKTVINLHFFRLSSEVFFSAKEKSVGPLKSTQRDHSM